MKQVAKYIVSVILILIAFFLIVKVGFLYYNFRISPFLPSETFKVLWYGMAMDISVAAIIASITWYATIPAIFCKRIPLRKVLVPWYIFLSFWLGFACWGDVMLYEAWGFKLNYAVFSYLSSPGEGTAGMTWWYLISRILLVIGTMVVVGGGLIWITPKRLAPSANLPRTIRHTVAISLGIVFLASLYWLMPRGSSMRGHYSECLFLNNAAQNPLFTLAASSIESNKPFDHQFQLMEAEEAEKHFQGLYPATNGLTDTLLKHQEPNILLIQLESQSSIFIEELGGLKNITPRQSEMIKEGVLFEKVYANSFRTDRGLVCTFSGHISYPSTSLMLRDDIRHKLPSLAKSLSSAGYTTEFIYGGNLNGMQANKYLNAVGYTRQTDMYDLAPKGKTIVSAAPDSLSAQHVFQVIKQKTAKEKWHIAYQTITSHEPFEAPVRILPNDTLNAFAYTDAAIGRLVDSLKTMPQVWENLLVVLIPDHGCRFRRNFEHPDYFHIPMIWCGGAVSKHGMRIDKIMNQSDMAATLLAQLGISHDEYIWSRNVLSPHYTYPSAYSTWPSGYSFIDESGATSYDLYDGCMILESPTDHEQVRLKRGRAILQTGYKQIDTMKDDH